MAGGVRAGVGRGGGRQSDSQKADPGEPQAEVLT